MVESELWLKSARKAGPQDRRVTTTKQGNTQIFDPDRGVFLTVAVPLGPLWIVGMTLRKPDGYGYGPIIFEFGVN